MAATPTAMQTKKKSSRRHDERVSRTAIRSTKHHRETTSTPECSTTRPSRSTSRASGHRRQLGVVGDEDQRRPPHRVDVAHQIHDVPAVGAVEIAGRLVGQQDRRIVGQRPRQRHALLLSARQLRRVVMRAAGQADLLEQSSRPRHRVGRPPRFPSARRRSRAPSTTE